MSWWMHEQECDFTCDFKTGCAGVCILVAIHGGDHHVCAAHREAYFAQAKGARDDVATATERRFGAERKKP